MLPKLKLKLFSLGFFAGQKKKKPVLVMSYSDQMRFKFQMKNIYKFAKRKQLKNELEKV